MRRRTGLMTCLRARGLRDLGCCLGIPALMGAWWSGLDGRSMVRSKVVISYTRTYIVTLADYWAPV